MVCESSFALRKTSIAYRRASDVKPRRRNAFSTPAISVRETCPSALAIFASMAATDAQKTIERFREPVTLPEGPLTETVTIPEAPVPAVTETVIPAEAPAPAPAAVPAAERDYFIWPVGGTVDQPYSMDALTFNTTLRDWRTHDGVDIAAELGTQVKACANGTVAELRQDDLFGTTLILSHRDGLVTVYANLAELPVVSVGDRVSVGQVIGAVGDTALAEAGQVCHLHFAMALDGESVDPGDYLP